MQPRRNILQIVPARDWDAICLLPDSPPVRIPTACWTITEETRPSMSVVAGLDEDRQFFDEQPEFVGYAHKSTPTEKVLARFPRKSASNLGTLPWRGIQYGLRAGRLAGWTTNADYPTFRSLISGTSAYKKPGRNELPLQGRRILAIMPATQAHAIYYVGKNKARYEPIFVWALAEEPDGSQTVAGIDAENFLCDEWTNFVGYEPQPPKPDEFHVTTFGGQ